MKSQPEISQINIKEFDYELPQDRIAVQPTEERDQSRLLICNNGVISHDYYLNIASHLPSHAVMIFNNTKVIAARLHFTKQTGAVIEIFLLEPADGNYSALSDKRKSSWKCLVGGIKKWKNDEALKLQMNIGDKEIILSADIATRSDEYCVINFEWDDHNLIFSELIEAAGKIPLPPYIKREVIAGDKARYQTVYAKHDGSVAAPTAGLHFTDAIFKSLHKKEIETKFTTLHVGAGTFKPVSAQTIAEHIMHEEYIEVSRALIESLAVEHKTIVAVGTTSLRTIESIFWIGIQIARGKEFEQGQIHLSQWEHLMLSKTAVPSRVEVMQSLLTYMKKHQLMALKGHTGICITPGYRFRVAEALVTNFHQPQSTLLLIIAAIVGVAWKNMYANALENGYRFLSYGDGCLLFMQHQANN
jgi:S-adenosylmethionine:tRNA ribosyltransferase-isomerase